MKISLINLIVFSIFAVMILTACNSEACEKNYCDCESVGEGIPQDLIDMPVASSFIEVLNPRRNYTIAVNKDNKYEFGGKYNKNLRDDIVYMSDYDDVPRPVEFTTYVAFSGLKEQLKDQYDIDIALVSAYRDKTEQRMVNLGYYTDLPKGKVEFKDFTKPGYSEHHTGLLVRFAILKDKAWTTDKSLTSSSDYDAVWNELADYGFIVRYPKNKKSITGKKYDPYEIRFVGSRKIAQKITSEGICLEEYLEEYE